MTGLDAAPPAGATLRVAVPGNLLLLGEYAITEPGAPAAALAVLPEVYAELTLASSRSSEPTVPGEALAEKAVDERRIDGRMGERRFGWSGDLDARPQNGQHVQSVAGAPATGARSAPAAPTLLDALVAVCGPPAGVVTVDSSDFADAGGKLGLGSSAAVAVAVAALLLAGTASAPTAGAAGRGRRHARTVTASQTGPRSTGARSTGEAGSRPPRTPQILAAAYAAHRRMQGGVGSGYDVVTSLHGGWLALTAGNEGEPPAAVSAQRPPVQLYLVRGPEPVATVGAVAAFRRWCAAHPRAAARFATRSAALVRALLDAGDAAAATAWCAAVADGAELLRWLGARIGVEVEPPLLRQRLDVFRARGWAAKAIGSGGELGLAVAPEGVVAPAVSGAVPLRDAASGLQWLS